MSKAVMISIQPKWCEKIASGKKTVELRKTKPDIETPFKVYIYCTKPKGKYDYGLCIDRGVCGTLKSVGLLAKCNYEFAEKNEMPILSGKIIGEFVCDEIKRIHCQSIEKEAIYAIAVGNGDKEYYDNSCVSYKEAYRYLRNVKKAYGWHISDLVIYDEPKEILSFSYPCKEDCDTCKYNRLNPWANSIEPVMMCQRDVTKAPQSWCYVEELK